jgi:hypothetical protein
VQTVVLQLLCAESGTARRGERVPYCARQ